MGRCVRACLVLHFSKMYQIFYESKANNPPYSGESLSKYRHLIAIRNAGVLDYFSFCQIKPVLAKTLTDCIRTCLAALPEDTILSWQAGIVRFLCKWAKRHGAEKSMPRGNGLFAPERAPLGTAPVAIGK